MAKDCVYCGLQFSDTTHFCPNCGRSTESGFSIRPIQEFELECLRGEMKEKDDLIRQLVLSLRFKSPAAQVHLSSIFSQKDVFEAHKESGSYNTTQYREEKIHAACT